MAGESIGVARDFLDDLRVVFSNPTVPLHARSVIVNTVRETLSQRQSAEPLTGCLLLSGFIKNAAILVSAWDDATGLHVVSGETYLAVGEGDEAATLMLNHREYHENLSIHTATYLVYEAKRMAECVNSVGPHTVLAWQAPPLEADLDSKARLNMLSPLALGALDRMFQQYGPQPVPAVGTFPAEFFMLPGRE